jgi:hypothetical protein
MQAPSGEGVGPIPRPDLFETPVPLRACLHRGGSCGYPGGCNNGSPDEPLLYFRVIEPPAWTELGLWLGRPGLGQEPELRDRIERE